MKQENRTFTYLLKFAGTAAFGSVCSFVHDHAVFKLIDLLAKLEEGCAVTYHIDRVSCGNADQLAVEYSEAQVTFSGSADASELEENIERLICETGYTGITYQLI